MKNLIFVDCEANGGCPATGQLTEFGAVHYGSRDTFHGVLFASQPSPDNPAVSLRSGIERESNNDSFGRFAEWLEKVCGNKRPIFVSDNVAYDWQWINDGFHRAFGYNPFGHSGRRISDFYAGLCGDFTKTQEWKSLRITSHDHNPVNDAMGNVEAFERLLQGER